jgi:glycosyltransferase involved in cell wall biosynthesis
MRGMGYWLGRYGHRVTVLTGFPNYPSGVIDKKYSGKVYAHESFEGVEVIRTWVFAAPHNHASVRLLNYFSFVVSSIVAGCLFRGKIDVVIASSPPLFLGISGLFISWVRRAPFVFDIRDLWPDVGVEAGVFTEKDIRVRLSRKLATFLYRRADHLIPVTERKREKLIAAGISPAKMSVVPNGVDLDRMPESDGSDWRSRLADGASLLITYTGLLGLAQGLGVVIDSAILLRENRGIRFVIVGAGVERESLVEKTRQAGLTNILFLESQPRETVLAILKASDIALVPLVSDTVDDAIPSKLMEAWACRKAVLLVAGGEAASLVRKAGGGIVVPPKAPDLLAAAVVNLSSDTELLRSYGESGYAYVQAHLNHKNLAKRLEQVVVNVTAKTEQRG